MKQVDQNKLDNVKLGFDLDLPRTFRNTPAKAAKVKQYKTKSKMNYPLKFTMEGLSIGRRILYKIGTLTIDIYFFFLPYVLSLYPEVMRL